MKTIKHLFVLSLLCVFLGACGGEGGGGGGPNYGNGSYIHSACGFQSIAGATTAVAYLNYESTLTVTITQPDVNGQSAIYAEFYTENIDRLMGGNGSTYANQYQNNGYNNYQNQYNNQYPYNNQYQYNNQYNNQYNQPQGAVRQCLTVQGASYFDYYGPASRRIYSDLRSSLMRVVLWNDVAMSFPSYYGGTQQAYMNASVIGGRLTGTFGIQFFNTVYPAVPMSSIY